MPPTTPSRKRKKAASSPSPSPSESSKKKKKKPTKEERQRKLREDAERAKRWAEERAAKKAAKKQAGSAASAASSGTAAAAAAAASTTPTKSKSSGASKSRSTPARRTPVRKAPASSRAKKKQQEEVSDDDDDDEDMDDATPSPSPSPPAKRSPKRRKVSRNDATATATASPDEAAGSPSPKTTKMSRERKREKLREDAERARAWAEARAARKGGVASPRTAAAAAKAQPPVAQRPAPRPPPAASYDRRQQQPAAPSAGPTGTTATLGGPPLGVVVGAATTAATAAAAASSSAAARFRAAASPDSRAQFEAEYNEAQQRVRFGIGADGKKKKSPPGTGGTEEVEVGAGIRYYRDAAGDLNLTDRQYRHGLHGSEEGEGAEGGKRAGLGGTMASVLLSPVRSAFVRAGDLLRTAAECIVGLVKFAVLAAVAGLALAAIYSVVLPTLQSWEGKDGLGGAKSDGKADGSAAAAAVAPPCFVDSAGVPPSHHEEEGGARGWWSAVVPPATARGDIAACSLDDEWVPCPRHGRCARGFLIDCLGVDGDSAAATAAALAAAADRDAGAGLLVVSDTYDGCVLSPEAERIVDLVRSTIVDLTVAQTCSLGCKWGIASQCGGVRPDQVLTTRSTADLREFLFTIDGLVDAIASSGSDSGEDKDEDGRSRPRVTANVVERLEPYFDKGAVQYVVGYKSDDKDGAGATTLLDPLVGLTADFVTTRLPVPALCWIRMLLADLLRLMLCVVVDLIMKYPLQSAFAVLVLYVYAWIRRRRRRNALLRAEIAGLRELAYDRLAECDDGEGYASLHLRDDLGHELHPHSVGDRRHMFDVVWPRVADEVRKDNRIGKVVRTVGGKPLEHWEWVANASKKSRRSRGGGAGGGMLSPSLGSASKKKKDA